MTRQRIAHKHLNDMTMKRRDFLFATTGIAGAIVAPQARAAKPCPPPLVSAPASTITSASCGGNSTLSSLAASMAPGTWAELVVPNQVQILGAASHPSPGVGMSINFANKMPWNPITKTIDMCISDHVGATPAMEYTRYIAATNAFEMTLPAGNAGISGIGHGYDHTDINPFNGDVYHHKYNSAATVRKRLTDSTFQALSSDGAAHQVAEAACYWSGSFTGAGAQGCWLVYASGVVPGAMSAYDPLTGSWFWNNQTVTPSNGNIYQTTMAYSPVKNCAVFGGGSAGGGPSQSNKLWRLNSDRTVTAMPDAPRSAGVDVANFINDPVTGNFLLLSARELWELNPTGSGTWTQQTGGRVPPAAVGNVKDINTGVIVSAIAEHRVVAFITMTSPGAGTFFLYKHA